jgi:hypothetical protein
MLKDVKDKFYSTFEDYETSMLNIVYNASHKEATHFIGQLLPVVQENKTPFTPEYVKSNKFKCMILETYLECMMIMQATLRNEDIDSVVAYVYSNPVKDSPFVKMIQEKHLSFESHTQELVKTSSKDLEMPTDEMIERLATAKTYLQRPALLQRMDSLEDKTSISKKVKI